MRAAGREQQRSPGGLGRLPVQGSDTMPHDPTRGQLTTKQRKAIAALLATGEVKAAAAEAGVHRDTLHRWLKEPTFLTAVRAAETDALDELSRLLVRLGRTAVDTIAKVMGDPETPPATRVRAADAALGRLLQLRELAQLEARVQALEQAAGVEGGRR
jgi:hypothetical protein